MPPSVEGSSWAWRCDFQGRRIADGPRQSFHRIQIKHDAPADRLPMQVYTLAGEVFAIQPNCLRLSGGCRPSSQWAASHWAARNRMGCCFPLPEAKTMRAEAACSRTLPNADCRRQNGPARSAPRRLADRGPAIRQAPQLLKRSCYTREDALHTQQLRPIHLG